MTPIGTVVGGRAEAVDDDWGDVEATIALDPQQFTADAVAALDSFSHLDVIFVFHLVEDDEIETGSFGVAFCRVEGC